MREPQRGVGGSVVVADGLPVLGARARAVADFLGGFAPLALMEDVDIARRIGAKRLRLLDAAAMTSAVRYRRDGYWLRPARNLLCLGLYLCGVPPRLIDGLYR